MNENATSADPDPVSQLNQLLQLDHDSVAGYTATIEALEDEAAQLALIRHRGDHQRHIVELARLIRRHGGDPVAASSEGDGIFAWDADSLRSLGGDREILLAFAADERRVRRAYREHAEQLPAEGLRQRLMRHLEDEDRHCAWARRALGRLEAGTTEPARQGRRGAGHRAREVASKPGEADRRGGRHSLHAR